MDLNDFEKMVHSELLQKCLVVLFSIAFFWKLIRHMWSFLNIEKDPVRVLVTGAAGMHAQSIILLVYFSFI
jgi:malate dehydrogenase